MLFGEFGIGDEEEKEEDWKDGEKEEDKYKDDKDKINATHKLLELTLYRDMMDKGHSPDEPPFVTYPTVEKILIPASLYDALASEEGRQYDGIHQYDGMPEVVRVVVEVK